MKGLLRDALVLLLIGASVWLITRVRLHSRQIERNRAELIYTTAIDDGTAVKLLNELEQIGFLNGVPRTFHLDRVEGINELLVVAQPSVIGNPQVENLLRNGFQAVCDAVFQDQQAMVKLADQNLKSFHLLVAPR